MDKGLLDEGAYAAAIVRHYAAKGYGEGRVLAYATDCAPHWSPVEFCEWPGYQTLWSNIVRWLTRR